MLSFVSDALTGENGGVVILVIFVLAAIIIGGYKLAKALAPLFHLLEDLRGTPARAGVDARPGMMERLKSLDDKHEEQNKAIQDIKTEQGEQSKKIETIRHEVQFNNGTSVKDAAIRTEIDVKVVKEEVGELRQSVDAVRELLEPGSSNGNRTDNVRSN